MTNPRFDEFATASYSCEEDPDKATVFQCCYPNAPQWAKVGERKYIRPAWIFGRSKPRSILRVLALAEVPLFAPNPNRRAILNGSSYRMRRALPLMPAISRAVSTAD